MINLNTLQLLEKEEIDNSIKHKLKRIQAQEKFKHSNAGRFHELTRREIEIVMLLTKGYNNPQIADLLYISRYTVEQHRKNINKKLGIHSFPKLFQYALAFDLI